MRLQLGFGSGQLAIMVVVVVVCERGAGEFGVAALVRVRDGCTGESEAGEDGDGFESGGHSDCQWWWCSVWVVCVVLGGVFGLRRSLGFKGCSCISSKWLFEREASVTV